MNPFNVALSTILLSQFVLIFFTDSVSSQLEPSIELPVQLVGFPVIILAVRVSNFVKKLAYALSPATYAARTKRDLASLGRSGPLIDVSVADKKLVEEFGKDVCIYEDICLQNAIKASAHFKRNQKLDMDFGQFLKAYEKQPNKMKEYYLLSVFLGEIIASPEFCKQLAKREHRRCLPSTS